MQLTPRYEGGPIITMDGDPSLIRAPFLRQRRRLVETLRTLDVDQWSAPSRCDAWTSQDVVTHLVDTDPFWTASLRAGLAGNPTTMLVGFDPDATPAAMVGASAAEGPEQTVEAFTAATDELCALVESLGDDDFEATAEAPPGHVSVSAVLHHALWDGWVHERDIVIPLGVAPVVDDDEVVCCLRYGAALTTAFSVLYTPGSAPGAMTVAVTDPAVTFHVVVGDGAAVVDGVGPVAAPTLDGPAVDVLEALSVRRPLEHDFGDDAWMLVGLRTVFDAD